MLMLEVEASNKQAIQIKQTRKNQEMKEEQAIIEYNRKKLADEEAAVKETHKMREAKEAEIKRLRDMQEKAADRQAEIDELRAKRAFEHSERLARSRELAEFEK
jgi:fumarylacetoacetate (FAA) hydrolase family protein